MCDRNATGRYSGSLVRPPGLIEHEHGHEAGVVVAKVMHKVEADVWRLVGHGTRERACPERAAPQGGADGHRGAGVLRQPQLRELRVHVSATTLRRTRSSWPLTFIARVSPMPPQSPSWPRPGVLDTFAMGCGSTARTRRPRRCPGGSRPCPLAARGRAPARH